MCVCWRACVRYASSNISTHIVERTRKRPKKTRKKIVYGDGVQKCALVVFHRESIFCRVFLAVVVSFFFFPLFFSPFVSQLSFVRSICFMPHLLRSHTYSISLKCSSSSSFGAGLALLRALVFPYALVAHHICACTSLRRLLSSVCRARCVYFIPFIYFYDQLVSYEINTAARAHNQFE